LIFCLIFIKKKVGSARACSHLQEKSRKPQNLFVYSFKKRIKHQKNGVGLVGMNDEKQTLQAQNIKGSGGCAHNPATPMHLL
jgi:hypothetical protein